MTSPDPAVVAHAIRDLRIATACTCAEWRRSERHAPDCRWPWREDVDTLAAEVERLRRVDELARALVERWRSGHLLPYDGSNALLDALAAEVTG